MIRSFLGSASLLVLLAGCSTNWIGTWDVAFPELDAVPRERVWTEYGPDISFVPEVVMSWGEGVQLQLEVTRSTQIRIVLEGQARVTDPNTLWDDVDATVELGRWACSCSCGPAVASATRSSPPWTGPASSPAPSSRRPATTAARTTRER